MAKVKVKLLTSRVEQRGDLQIAQGYGDVIEVEADEAKRLFESQQAEPVAAPRAKRASKATKTEDVETR